MDLRVLIIEPDEFLRQTLASQIESLGDIELAGSAADPTAGQRLAAQQRPDVVLIGMTAEIDAALGLAEWLRLRHPETVVLVAAPGVQPELMRRVMRSGARDLLSRPVDPGQFRLALNDALEEKRRRLQTQEKLGSVITVFGMSGGIGTTTIATNLAVAMAGMKGTGPVAIADFDLQMGNVPCFLDLRPERTYMDLLTGDVRADGDGLRQLLPRHGSGLYVLPGPQNIEDLDAVTGQDVVRTVDLCRGAFRHVIVDAGHGLDERRMELLDRADRILLVMQLSVAALHGARRTTAALERLGYPLERTHVVATRVGRGTQVNLEDVERSVGQPVRFTVPNDYPAVIAAIDTGVPLVESKRSRRTAASLRALAQSLATSTNGNGNGNGGTNGNSNGNGNGRRGSLKALLGPRRTAKS